MELVGLGNCLMDIVYVVDDQTVNESGLVKGIFNLVDDKKSKELKIKFKKNTETITFGGSIGNALSVYSRLGGSALLIGKVGNDVFGKEFEKQIIKEGVVSALSIVEGETGTVQALITPDAQRTFATCLGVSNALTSSDIDFEKLSQSRIIHTSCYELCQPMDEAVVNALEFAKKNKIIVSIDLADPVLIKNLHHHMQPLVCKYADIVFANDAEAEMFTGKSQPDLAQAELGKLFPLAVVKHGDKGSSAISRGKVYKILPVKANAVDTTGAGDAYAGSFLYSLVKGYNIPTSGKLASLIAAKTVESFGPHLGKFPTREIKEILASKKFNDNNDNIINNIRIEKYDDGRSKNVHKNVLTMENQVKENEY